MSNGDSVPKRHRTVADFVADPAFVDWIIHPTPQAIAYWQKWQRNHADQREALEEARRLVIIHYWKEQTLSQTEKTSSPDHTSQKLNSRSILRTNAQKQYSLYLIAGTAVTTITLLILVFLLLNR